METEERTEVQRQPLSRERILAAALELVDAEGLDALTMRRLAGQLGVAPMALYTHIRSKEELLAGLLDEVAGQVRLPSAGSGWKEGLGGVARSIRRLMLRHPAVVPLVTGGEHKTGHGPNVLRIFEAVLGTLRRAGFADDRITHAFFCVYVYTVGFVGQEVSWSAQGAPDAGDRAEWERHMRLQFESLPIREFPMTVELAPLLARCADNEYFEYGLQAMLDGIEARLDRR